MGPNRGDSTSGEGLVSGDCGASWVWSEELEVDKEHVHLFVSFLPKYSIGQVVGLFKPVSAKEMWTEFPEVASNCGVGSLGRIAILCER